MTREEILHDHVDAHCFLKPLCYEAAIDAMDQYAKQEAIEFKNWLDKRSRFLMDEAVKMPIIIVTKFETNDQLYELFSHSIDNKTEK